MLTQLYRYLARMGAAQEDGSIDEITEDMIGTFEEARLEARERGPLHYLRFGGREIMGQFARLMGTPERLLPKGLVTWTVLGALLGVLVSGTVWLFSPVAFRSEAAVTIRGPQIPDDLLDTSIPRLLTERVPTIEGTILSRSRLMQIIRNQDLYPRLTAEFATDEAVQRMQDHIEFRFDGTSRIDLSAEYSSGEENGLTWLLDESQDQYAAQKIVEELVAQIVSANVESRSRMTYQSQEFLASQLETAWSRWADLNARLKQLSPSDPVYPRVELDRDMARQRYISIQERHYAAQELNELQQRAQGERFEVMERALLPIEPVRTIGPSMQDGALAGTVGGLGIWLLLLLRRMLQGSSSPMTADAS